MGPGEEGELPHVVALHQRQHEPHEANDVPDKGQIMRVQLLRGVQQQ